MRRALLLVGLLCAPLPVLASPPSEDVLRPDVPSTGRWYIEPHAGINLTSMTADSAVRERIQGEGELDIYRSASGLAPLIGLTFGYQFDRRAAFELDVSYDSRRASNKGSTLDGCEIIDPISGVVVNTLEPAEKEYTVGVDYVSIGLSGTYSFGMVFLQAGPTVSVPISSIFEERMHWSDAGTFECEYFYGTPEATREIVGTPDALAEATRVSVRVGAGLLVEIGDGIELVPRVAYDFALNEAFDGSDFYVFQREGSTSEDLSEMHVTTYNGALRLSSLQASVGIRFPL